MTKHSQALVPIETWSYNAPELRYQGYSIDIGLAAESLLYYDTIWINVTNQSQLAAFIEWFTRQGRYRELISLIQEGVIKIYEYSFATAAVLIMPEQVYMLRNIQDQNQAKPNTFEQRFLYHPDVQAVLPNSRERRLIYQALRNNVYEAKAAEFESAIENAKIDEAYPQRNALIVQSYVDELFRFRNLGPPPSVSTFVNSASDLSKTEITWNVSFDELSKLSGPNLNFGIHTPLTGNAISNRLLLSASIMDCDLFLGTPMSTLVGDKLYESSYRILKLSDIVDTLQMNVEFPDVRTLVNQAKLNLDDILSLRNESKKFRGWLKQESDRDRDAIIAYHKEVAEATGLVKFGQSSLRLFGLVAAATAGVLIHQAYPDLTGELVGAAVTTLGAAYLPEIAAKLHQDWKPIVFGNWMQERIKHILEEFE